MLLLLSALGGCGFLSFEVPRDPPLIPEEVDSLVLPPFATAANVEINPVDLAKLDQRVRELLSTRDRFRLFETPPIRLPNTAVVKGILEEFSLREKPGKGVYLRTIDLEAELSVYLLDEEEPLARLRRRISYQKAYPGTDGVSAPGFDLESAFRELAQLLVEGLDPLQPGGEVGLQDARDPNSGADLTHPALHKGNRYAMEGQIGLAIQMWQRVLFDPTEEVGEQRTYRITTRTLNQMRRVGVEEDLLERLQPLMGESPLTLVPFRKVLRAGLNGTHEREGLILTMADLNAASLHSNVAAAHANLGSYYRARKRHDLASFHLARAYAHNPDPALLERWTGLQRERNLNPGGMADVPLMEQFLSLPPPKTSLFIPGVFDLAVVPPPAFGPAPGISGPAGSTPAGSTPPPADGGNGAGARARGGPGQPSGIQGAASAASEAGPGMGEPVQGGNEGGAAGADEGGETAELK